MSNFEHLKKYEGRNKIMVLTCVDEEIIGLVAINKIEDLTQKVEDLCSSNFDEDLTLTKEEFFSATMVGEITLSDDLTVYYQVFSVE